MASLASNRKLIVSKDRIEVYRFHNFYSYGKTGRQKPKKTEKTEKKLTPSELYMTDSQLQDKKDRYRLANRIRSQSNLVRLVNTNKVYDRGRHSFLTLTYKEDVRDIKKAQRDFAKFIQRLNYLYYKGKKKNDLRYVSVIEFQDLNRNGVIHFHVILFDVSFIHWNTLTKCWSHGSIDIEAKDKSGKPLTVTRIARYMAKYMAKGFDDVRLNGHKKYSCSTHLERPLVYREPAHVDSLHTSLFQCTPVYVKKYTSKFMGESVYIIYENLPQELVDFLLSQNPPFPRYAFPEFDN